MEPFRGIILLAAYSFELSSFISCGLTAATERSSVDSQQTCSGTCQQAISASRAQQQSDLQHWSLDDLEAYAEQVVKKMSVKFATGTSSVDRKLAFATLLVNAKKYDEAIVGFTALIKANPELYGAYIGRGTAYTYKGITNITNAEQAIKDFTTAISLNDKDLEGFERRAEVLTYMGHYGKALLDVQSGLALKTTPELYALGGRILYLQGRYHLAHIHLQKSLDLNPKQPETMKHMAMMHYSMGKMKEGITLLKEAHVLDSKQALIPFYVGLSYRELGDAKQAGDYHSLAIRLNPMSPDMHYGRGQFLYSSGHHAEALEDFGMCLSFDAGHISCIYFYGLALTSLGLYFPAIKAYTEIFMAHPKETHNGELIHAGYMREYSRYLHARLDQQLQKLALDDELDERFRSHWSQQQFFDYQNYTEQPGLQPYTSDVETPDFDELDVNTQALLCKAADLGAKTEFQAPGVLPNVRRQLAAGMAAIRIAQALEKLWQPQAAKKIGWRDIFHVAVSWQRMVDPSLPMFWFDKLRRSAKKDHMNEIYVHREYQSVVRYQGYEEQLVRIIKDIALGNRVPFKGKDLSHAEKVAIKSANNCTALIRVWEGKNKGQQRDHTFQLYVPSYIKSGRHIAGVKIILAGDGRSESYILALDLAHTKATTSRYVEELDRVWNDLSTNAKKETKDHQGLIDLLLLVLYYFINLCPLTRGTTVTAFAAFVGMLAAIGHELAKPLRQDHLLDMEAWLTNSSSHFKTKMREFLQFQRLSAPLSSMPLVKDTLPSLRHSIEILNLGSDRCHK